MWIPGISDNGRDGYYPNYYEYQNNYHGQGQGYDYGQGEDQRPDYETQIMIKGNFMFKCVKSLNDNTNIISRFFLLNIQVFAYS